MTKISIFLCLGLLFIAGCSNNPADSTKWESTQAPNATATPTPVPLLAFPFSNPDIIQRLAPFGEPNWSGTLPHNGIDLIVNTTVANAELIAPISGTITKIDIRENPYSNPVNQLIVDVTLEASSSFIVNFVIEPSTTSTTTKNQQQASLSVAVDQTVTVGDRIGYLIVGELGYPHLHYMLSVDNQTVCAHHHSTTAAQATFNTIATRSSREICK
jgi:murein DD-endopeptidase MepM/ murein hydrolase activator NlpD